MKRTFLILIALIALCLTMAAPACAASGDFVVDGGLVLTDQQSQELSALAREITEKYQCDVRIYVVDDMGTDDAYAYAKMVYRENQFGYGSDDSGLLLVLSLADRDYALIAFGFGNTAFTDHGKNVLLDKYVLPLLKENKYYEAFLAYFDKASEFLAMARAGTPFDVDTDAGAANAARGAKIAFNIIIPVVVALIVCLVFRSRMKTAKKQRAAASYIPEGGFVLTGSNDTYLYSTETRTAISEKSGGTSVDSGGFSGSSGKF